MLIFDQLSDFDPPKKVLCNQIGAYLCGGSLVIIYQNALRMHLRVPKEVLSFSTSRVLFYQDRIKQRKNLQKQPNIVTSSVQTNKWSKITLKANNQNKFQITRAVFPESILNFAISESYNLYWQYKACVIEDIQDYWIQSIANFNSPRVNVNWKQNIKKNTQRSSVNK